MIACRDRMLRRETAIAAARPRAKANALGTIIAKIGSSRNVCAPDESRKSRGEGRRKLAKSATSRMQ
jgi:hypothetical protein